MTENYCAPMSHRIANGTPTPSQLDLPLLTQELASSSAELLESLRDCRGILGDFRARRESPFASPRRESPFASPRRDSPLASPRRVEPSRQIIANMSAPSPTRAIPESKTDLRGGLKIPLPKSGFRERGTQTPPRNQDTNVQGASKQSRLFQDIQESATQTSPKSSLRHSRDLHAFNMMQPSSTSDGDLEEGLLGVDCHARNSRRLDDAKWKEVEELKAQLRLEIVELEVANAKLLSPLSPPTPSFSTYSSDSRKRFDRGSLLSSTHEQVPTALPDTNGKDLQTPERLGDYLAISGQEIGEMSRRPDPEVVPELVGNGVGNVSTDRFMVDSSQMQLDATPLPLFYHSEDSFAPKHNPHHHLSCNSEDSFAGRGNCEDSPVPASIRNPHHHLSCNSQDSFAPRQQHHSLRGSCEDSLAPKRQTGNCEDNLTPKRQTELLHTFTGYSDDSFGPKCPRDSVIDDSLSGENRRSSKRSSRALHDSLSDTDESLKSEDFCSVTGKSSFKSDLPSPEMESSVEVASYAFATEKVVPVVPQLSLPRLEVTRTASLDNVTDSSSPAIAVRKSTDTGSEIPYGSGCDFAESHSDNSYRGNRPRHGDDTTDDGRDDKSMGRARTSTCISEARVRRTSTHTVLANDSHLTPVMCEVEYPWMYDRPLLYLTKVPNHVLPETYSQHVLTMHEHGQFEVTQDEWNHIVSYYFGDAFRERVKTAFCENNGTDGIFWKVIFIDLQSAREAMLLAKQTKKPNVTFVSPTTVPRRRCDIFISNFERDHRQEVIAFLRSIRLVADMADVKGYKPIEVTRFTADYDPKRPDSKKLIWRATYNTEEAAKLVHGLAALKSSQKDDRTRTWNCTVSYQPNPFTKGLLICFRSPNVTPVVLQKLQYYHPYNDSVVEGFKYALHSSAAGDAEVYEKGDIFYDDDESEDVKEGQMYARLITQNWWYTSLLWALIYASLALMDLYSNIILSVSLFSAADLAFNTDFRYNFVLSFFGLQVFLALHCWRDSTADIDFQITHSGDLIQTKTLMDRILLKAAAFTFSFVQIPGGVKSIVKTLHPWTNVQEKSAQKMAGSRTFLISYPNAQLYRVGEMAGFQRQFPPIILSRFVLTLFKIMHAYSSRSWVSVFLCLAGVVLWPLQFASFKQLITDRYQMVEFIKKDAKAAKLEVDDLNDLILRQDYLSSKEKSVLAIWRKNFGDFTDLHKYNKITDSMPWDFWATVIILILANLIIFSLQWVGVLKPGGAVMKWRINGNLSLRSLSANMAAADMNGDAVLSLSELASANTTGHQLAMLLRSSMMEM